MQSFKAKMPKEDTSSAKIAKNEIDVNSGSKPQGNKTALLQPRLQSREIMYLNYEGFDEIMGVPKEIKIDFNMKANLYGESQLLNVIESYSDQKDKSSLLNVMTVETILANKIGMLFACESK